MKISTDDENDHGDDDDNYDDNDDNDSDDDNEDQICNKSANFQARSSRFCMVIDLEST